MIQRERVLRQLKRTGRVSPIDFLLPNVCDCATPILRVAPRIMELRDEGYEITTSTARDGTAVYELVEREPSDFEMANRHGYEGGIAYGRAA